MPSTPAFMVSWSIMAADLGSTLVAFAYLIHRSSPDGTKKAPLTIISPSVLQFHFDHTPSSVSTLFVTYIDTHSKREAGEMGKDKD